MELEREEAIVEEEEGGSLEARQRRRKTDNYGAPPQTAESSGDEAEEKCLSDNADRAQSLLAARTSGLEPKKNDQNVIQEEPANGKSTSDIVDDHNGISNEGENQMLKNANGENGSNPQDYPNNRINIMTKSEEIIVFEQIPVQKKSASEAVGFDLERILDEQDTHDLYCPNCNSCITKRVILRKRKRTVKEIQHDVPSKKAHEEPDEPDIYRCLSCFSFFIPIVGGFNIFRIFEKGKESQLQSSKKVFEEKVDSTSSTVKVVESKRKGTDPDGAQIISPSEQKIEGSQATATNVSLQSDDIQIAVADQTFRESEISNSWDLLKSIVFGGLTESIASLGVVSSAAGVGASTLNIFALGLANLIGGFLLIVHELFELRAVQDHLTEQKDERVGRYWELLGQRANFRLHFIVAIISYIIFGLLPPVIYGFSFWKSDNREYKLLAVSGASLLCIALLAIGKAHVKSQKRYLKTLFYYLSIGVSASGISYVAGVMVNQLIEKLRLFDQVAAPSLPTTFLPQVSSSRVLSSPWASS